MIKLQIATMQQIVIIPKRTILFAFFLSLINSIRLITKIMTRQQIPTILIMLFIYDPDYPFSNLNIHVNDKRTSSVTTIIPSVYRRL